MYASRPPGEQQLISPQNRSPETTSTLRSAFEQQDNNHDNTNESPAEDDDTDPEKPTKRQKRSRACIACRGMKIRCLPVEGQDACLGCSKVNRECIMPGPARKRQKTVHKVAELEKKINALTDALAAKNQGNPTPPDNSPIYERSADSQSDITKSEVTASSIDSQKTIPGLTSTINPLMRKYDLATDKDWDLDCLKFKKDPTKEEKYIDVVDRGTIDMQIAEIMFDHWKFRLSRYFPVVAVPEELKAQDIRIVKPLTFLAALAVASSAVKPSLQQDLVVELNKQIADRVLYYGEKSLDLIQAILIYTSYYIRSKYARDLAFNQYIHAAVVMCLDLGMGKRYRPIQYKDPAEEAEIRRTWIGCHHVASNVATLLRHPTMVRWSPYMEECLQFFEKNPAALPSDKWLCCLVSLQRIAEEVSIVFNLDDPSADVTFTATKTQYHLKAFEKQLAAWRRTVPPSVDKRIVEHLASSIDLYIHEIAIHNDHNVDEFRPAMYDQSPSGASGSFITTAHIEALTTCIDSCHRILNAYLSFDIEMTRSVNNLFLVWNTYAMVALIKLHGVLNASDSKFGSIFNPDLQVDYYIDAITNRLAEAMKDGRWPPAEAFGFVTKKLKSWHTHKKAPYPEEALEADVSAGYKRASGQIFDENFSQVANKKLQELGLPENYSNHFPSSQQSDLNFAYDAANYNLNWDDLNFSASELNVFDTYMNDAGWMSYLI